MSAWDAYVTNMKAHGLQICGIFDLQGATWAKSAEFKVSAQEVANIVSGINSQSFPDGIHLNGVKYTVIQVSPNSVTAKCRNAPCDAEKYLMHAALCKTCVVLGGISGATERSATKIVEEIKDYLVNSNF
ncbi:profilin [Plakobranchus ocellatus]|uniref:Profilin n=1 Tax=Plakobranchus ocellatus TaxID=259542 RepID=A0AAV4A0S0_9GAST|nr:profilin [Plakobranchus ocellatus]